MGTTWSVHSLRYGSDEARHLRCFVRNDFWVYTRCGLLAKRSYDHFLGDLSPPVLFFASTFLSVVFFGICDLCFVMSRL